MSDFTESSGYNVTDLRSLQDTYRYFLPPESVRRAVCNLGYSDACQVMADVVGWYRINARENGARLTVRGAWIRELPRGDYIRWELLELMRDSAAHVACYWAETFRRTHDRREHVDDQPGDLEPAVV